MCVDPGCHRACIGDGVFVCVVHQQAQQAAELALAQPVPLPPPTLPPAPAPALPLPLPAPEPNANVGDLGELEESCAPPATMALSSPFALTPAQILTVETQDPAAKRQRTDDDGPEMQ